MFKSAKFLSLVLALGILTGCCCGKKKCCPCPNVNTECVEECTEECSAKELA